MNDATPDKPPPNPLAEIPIAQWPVDPSTPLFSVRPFALLFITRVASNTSNQMLAVAAGYQIYELTDSALHVGLIGLIQFMPPLLLMLLAGQVADRYNRRLILRVCFTFEFCMNAGLAIVSLFPHPNVTAIYILLLLNAVARTFEQPVMQSLVAVMVPRAILSRAIAAHISGGRISLLLGPSVGGVLYILGPDFDYGVCALLILAAAASSFLMPNPPFPATPPKITWETLSAGFRFIWRQKAILGAMAFDLSATLFGSVTALFPIYARDILEIGSWGAGILRSAPAVGALLTAAVLTRVPVSRHGGPILYIGFAIFGLSAIVFGLSTNVVLSVVALMTLGGGDILTTIVRQTLVQVTTPDEMRGRVGAASSFFIGSSAQLGSFRAGTMAAAFGAVGSAVVGGCAILLTVALWVWLFPSLLRVDRPDEGDPKGTS